MTKKLLIMFAAILCNAVFGAENFKNWTPTNGSILKKNPDAVKITANETILKGAGTSDWIFFRPAGEKVAAGNTVTITVKAAGKGKATFGFYEYHKGFSSNGTQNSSMALSEEAKEFKTTFTIKLKNTTIVRPRFVISPDSELKIFDYSLKVEGEPIPQYDINAVPDRADFIYKTGDTAKMTLNVSVNGQAVTAGELKLILLVNGVKKDTRTTTLSPVAVTYNIKLDEPGFALLLGELSLNGKTLVASKQIGAVAFSPENIKSGKAAPADLLEYWHNEFAKLNKEVAPEFKLEPMQDTASHKQWKLICNNFGGTKTYAAITIPKNAKGKLPMIFTVPPAGNYGYGFWKSSDAIHVTITVFDRLFAKQSDYLSFNSPVWYFYKGAEKRNTYYYYKSILGMMRVMDYAMTEIKEWDGKHLAAVGRSQGGGSAFIMAALNQKIQCVSADVPALCDHNARLANRRPGWPQLLDAKTTAANFAEDAQYFDAANFASFIKCPALVSVGFYDTMCEPASVYAAFNNLKGPKTILNQPRYGHGWGVRDDGWNINTKKLLKETFAK